MNQLVRLALILSLSSIATVSSSASGHIMPTLLVVNALEDGSDVEEESYPRVAAMEDALLGNTYAGDDLDARLARLENKAFGKASEQADLSERTDALQQYVEKKLNRKLFKEDPEFQTTPDVPSEPGQQPIEQSDINNQPTDTSSGGERPPGGSPNRMRSVGTMLGTTLLNVAGLGVPGFGGVRVRNRADLPPQEQAAMQANQHQEAQEEPAVFEKDPPPATAKLLTKVGWCEMQIWKHTFPSMHLPQRLSQLNEEIKFAPGKSGISLMDCSAAMIDAASKHQ